MKLDSCLADFNDENIRFIVNLGDLSDRNMEDLDSVISHLNKANAKVYNTAGNHDYHGFTNNDELYSKLNMPQSYYSFIEGNWRFIMLNTNEVASYSNIMGTPKEGELLTMLEHINQTGKTNGQEWNGGISQKQLEWLRTELTAAQEKEQHVLVFSHHPLYAAKGLTALNDDEILRTVSTFSCVKAIISGHHHSGVFGYYNGIPCITTEGMVETEYENAYGIVEISQNSIILNGKGRTKSYSFAL